MTLLGQLRRVVRSEHIDLGADRGADEGPSCSEPVHPSTAAHNRFDIDELMRHRSGKLTVSQAGRLLGLQSRYEMDGFLKAHVFLDLTLDDVRRDSDTALAFSK
jgi:hypothetical protein